MVLVQQRLKRALEGKDAELATQFKSYIKYICSGSKQRSEDYWKSTLKGRSYTIFPNAPRENNGHPSAKELVVHHMNIETKHGVASFTMPLIIRAGWAILAAHLSNSEEVLFGETLAGRDSPVPGIEIIEGPTFAVIPIRQRVDVHLSIDKFLKLVQQQKLEMMPHEHIGSRTRRLGEDALAATMYTTMLATQPQPIVEADKVVANEGSSDHPFVIMLTSLLTSDGVTFKASINTQVLPIETMKKHLSQLELIMRKLLQSPDMSIGELHAELHHAWDN